MGSSRLDHGDVLGVGAEGMQNYSTGHLGLGGSGGGQ